MIIETITETKFMDAFFRAGRGKQFSYDALECLFEYYDSLNDDINEGYELDVIGICCEWTESNPEEFLKDNGIELEEGEEPYQKAIKELDSSSITYFELKSGSILYMNY